MSYHSTFKAFITILLHSSVLVRYSMFSMNIGFWAMNRDRRSPIVNIEHRTRKQDLRKMLQRFGGFAVQCFFLEVFLISLAVTSAGGQLDRIPSPKQEVRAVWVTTAAGLDWPKSRDIRQQQATLREIVQTLHKAHFNTIFFQVRARGDAYYKSSKEPWAENLTGTLGQDPGWDPLAFLLNEAHTAGMEVHAWFNLYKVGAAALPARTKPSHISLAHPDWTFIYDDELWLNPGIPDVNRYLLSVAMELVRNYDMDGIQFDFIRYPWRNIPDQQTYRSHRRGLELADWRRSNINAFVQAFYDSATAIKPWMKIGSTPPGNFNGTRQPAAVGEFYQDALDWLKSGKHDYLVPQLYWDIGSSREDPDFASLAGLWQAKSSGRHTYTGIGSYKPEVFEEIAKQIDVARASGCLGQAFFRYENIRTGSPWRDRYRTIAVIPTMPWKDATPPDAPSVLAVTELEQNAHHLEWNATQPASSPNETRWYAIYRSSRPDVSTDDPSNLVAIVPGSRSSYIDTVATTEGPSYCYTVTALDRAGNESAPSPVASATARELVALRGILRGTTSLSVTYVDRSDSLLLITCRLPLRLPVSVQVRPTEANAAAPAYTFSMGFRNEGTHVFRLPTPALSPGSYLVRLETTDEIVEQILEVR